jgi:hypothetical protein
LVGANIGAASEDVASGTRGEFKVNIQKNAVDDPNLFHGNYIRANQGSQDTFGWAANPTGYISLAAEDEIGAAATMTGDNHTTVTQGNWVGFWGLDLNSLQAFQVSSGGAEATVDITSEGIGIKAGTGETTVLINEEGQGTKKGADSVEENIDIVPEGTYSIKRKAAPTSPATGSSNITLDVALNWTALDDTTNYQVQVSKEDQFLSTEIDTIVATNSFSSHDEGFGWYEPNTTYYWRVRGENQIWSDTLNFTTENAFASGRGISTDPFIIANTTQFLNILNYNGSATAPDQIYFEQSSDLDMAGGEGLAASLFQINYDGRGYKISNITRVENTSDATVGGFCDHARDCNFTDVNIDNLDLTVNGECRFTGGFVAYPDVDSFFERCKVSGSITITADNSIYNFIGGFVGRSQDNVNDFKDCWTDVTITDNSANGTNHWIGGFIGRIEQMSEMRRCYAVGAITPANSLQAGALVGNHAVQRTVEGCMFAPTETGISTASAPNSAIDTEATTDTTTITTNIVDFQNESWDIVDKASHDGQLATAE